jgi:polyhydroxyalkanoate synthesis regulator phasin
MLSAEGKYYGRVWYFRDITERKKMEEEIRKRLQELEVFYKASVGREERIVELKKKIAELEEKLKRV